jgi:hypothetical protein
VDLLIHDSFLLPAEVAAEASFGHPAADYAVRLARRARARRVLLTHHKPDRTDEALDALAARFSPRPSRHRGRRRPGHRPLTRGLLLRSCHAAVTCDVCPPSQPVPPAAVQGFTGPGWICNQPTVPGYPAYDPAKAKALVKQLGGLTVSLGTIQNLVAQQTTEALQTEWAAAGIKSTNHTYSLTALIAQFTSGKWQEMVQTARSYDPAGGVGVGFRFPSMSPFSGVHDPHLDSLLNQATAALSMSQRCTLYNRPPATSPRSTTALSTSRTPPSTSPSRT